MIAQNGTLSNTIGRYTNGIKFLALFSARPFRNWVQKTEAFCFLLIPFVFWATYSNLLSEALSKLNSNDRRDAYGKVSTLPDLTCASLKFRPSPSSDVHLPWI